MEHRASMWKLLAGIIVVGSTTLAGTQSDGINVTKPLPPILENQEMRVITIDLAPGHSSPPHRHNAHVFVYVLEGTIEMQVRGGDLTRLGPGETFYESPDNVHVVSRNASETETAKFLVHMLKTVGAPASVPVQ